MSIAIHSLINHKSGNTVIPLYPTNTSNDVQIDVTGNDNIPTSENNPIETLDDLIMSLGSLAFEDAVALKVGSDTEYGLVRMTDSLSNTGEDVVPTSSAVNSGLAGKVSTTGDETVAGVKTFSDRVVCTTVDVAGIRISRNAITETTTFSKIV